MHTYRRADGSFYDATAPENPADQSFPLRPSEVYQLDAAGRWVFQTQRGTRSVYPANRAEAENAKLSPENLALFLRMTLDLDERQESADRIRAEILSRLGALEGGLNAHLEEAEPLIEFMRDFQGASKITAHVSSWIVVIGRALYRLILPVAILWALVHGDLDPLKRALVGK